jgi:hypothetical protein
VINDEHLLALTNSSGAKDYLYRIDSENLRLGAQTCWTSAIHPDPAFQLDPESV